MPALHDKSKPDEATRAVCLLGHHEIGYPRNRNVKESLMAAGFRVLTVHSRAPFPWRHLILAIKYLRVRREVEWIWVTEGGHRLVPLVKLYARLTGRKVAFDPFLSRYNTRVEDRAMHRPGGLQALICRWQDWSSTRSADLLVFDTEEHREYFYRKYGLRKPFLILPVGVTESVFHPSGQRHASGPVFPGETAKTACAEFRVLFYGSYIPLQGVEWIVEAAGLLKDEAVRFTLIGQGQTRPGVEARARALGSGNLDFQDEVPEPALPGRIAAADVCLGIFGDTLKAANVVPNKVVQCAAMCRPMITRDSSAVRRYFKDGKDIVLVPPASPRALADAILALRNDAVLRESMGKGAGEAFEKSFSVTALSRILKESPLSTASSAYGCTGRSEKT